LYFADFLQKDFSAGADHFVSITESRQEGWRRKTKVENLITFHQWSRFTLKEHELPVNEGHTVFNMRGGVGGPSNVF
jgi:hypothetical protein